MFLSSSWLNWRAKIENKSVLVVFCQERKNHDMLYRKGIKQDGKNATKEVYGREKQNKNAKVSCNNMGRSILKLI